MLVRGAISKFSAGAELIALRCSGSSEELARRRRPWLRQSTFGKSGHRAWQWSLTLAARLRGQSAVSVSSAGRLRPPDERRRPRLRTGRKNPRCLSVGWRCLHGGGTARHTPPPSRNQPPEPCACALHPHL